MAAVNDGVWQPCWPGQRRCYASGQHSGEDSLSVEGSHSYSAGDCPPAPVLAGERLTNSRTRALVPGRWLAGLGAGGPWLSSGAQSVDHVGDQDRYANCDEHYKQPRKHVSPPSWEGERARPCTVKNNQPKLLLGLRLRIRSNCCARGRTYRRNAKKSRTPTTHATRHRKKIPTAQSPDSQDQGNE